MKKAFLTLALVFAGAIAFTAGQSPLAGRWRVHIAVAGVENDVTCTLTQTDTALGSRADVKLRRTVAVGRLR